MLDESTLARICRAVADALEPSGSIPEFDWRRLPIEPSFPVRLSNILYSAGIQTWGALLECSEDDLLELRNCGQTTVDELQTLLRSFGVSLKPKVGFSLKSYD
jgi:hypothetical protein